MARRLLLAAALAVGALPLRAADADLLDGFVEENVASGITGAVALAIAPDGRIFICEQTGSLRVVKAGLLLPDPFVTLDVDSRWERGLIGVTLDPRFPEQPYVYVHSVPAKPYPHHRISRFTAAGDVAEAGSEKILFEGEDQGKVASPVPWGHQGGALHFGPDGKLYFGFGDQRTGAPAQALDSFLGKMLRINADGSIPDDNPFQGKTTGPFRAIWAIGLRNPFAFAFHPSSGRMLINDVGESTWEEIDEGVAGSNYGWPQSEGPTTDPAFRAPIHAYGRGVGRSITGGVFYTATQFPAAYRDKYFFMDFEDHWIRVLDLDHPQTAPIFARHLVRPVDLAVGPDGCLYVLHRNAWVKDEKFKPNTGFLTRIRHVPGAVSHAKAVASVPVVLRGGKTLAVRTTPDGLPKLLSQTGIFASLETLEPVPGIVPYEVNSPLWSDGASKRRWMALPENGRIGFSAKGDWTFPAGTLFIKHFDLGRRLETRLLVVDGSGGGYGVTYRWRADRSDAELLERSETEHLGSQTWTYPGRTDCLACHTVTSGFVLGVKTRQLNRPLASTGNQIWDWSEAGYFVTRLKESYLATYDRLSALGDETASLDARARSYLDSNCSGCHRPGGTQSRIDTRFDIPPALQNLIDAPLGGVNLDVPDSKIIVPGDPAKSSITLRMKRRHDAFKMPPLASAIVDDAALGVLEAWIRGMKKP
ncbi:MAG TPA: PQQ-dependent sugar dehydrogenase [Planctomycetota bacterium]|nr:PQQ-dependent sugar dehydrogenase [Planctomycetota bacterium]